MSILIKDIEPIDKVGRNLLNESNPDEIIDSIIELPFRNICRKLKQKGIESVMSSANKNNILNPGETRKEREDVYGNGQQWFYPRPTYEDAGKGYAWIMLNFDTLSDENKDILFRLEETTDKNGNKIGEKTVWFVYPCAMGNLDFDLRSGRRTYEELLEYLSEDEIPKDAKYDPKLAEFDKRHIVLGYNSGLYPSQSVFLRMPIDETTTVDDVEKYFDKLLSILKPQNRNRDKATHSEEQGKDIKTKTDSDEVEFV